MCLILDAVANLAISNHRAHSRWHCLSPPDFVFMCFLSFLRPFHFASTVVPRCNRLQVCGSPTVKSGCWRLPKIRPLCTLNQVGQTLETLRSRVKSKPPTHRTRTLLRAKDATIDGGTMRAGDPTTRELGVLFLATSARANTAASHVVLTWTCVPVGCEEMAT